MKYPYILDISHRAYGFETQWGWRRAYQCSLSLRDGFRLDCEYCLDAA